MKKFLTVRLPMFLIGVIALFSLLCSVAAAGVTNPRLMEQGFLSYANTKHLSVSPALYGECAEGICNYLEGKSDAIVWQESGESMFSEKEMLHLSDVRGIVRFLKVSRWAGGGTALLGIAAAYALTKYRHVKGLMNGLFRGFAMASLFGLLMGAALGIWGAVNFEGLFVTFHLAAFSNNLWILDPNTDLLVALMPLPFFTWYVGELLKSLLPLIGIMICLPVAWFRLGRKERTNEENAK